MLLSVAFILYGHPLGMSQELVNSGARVIFSIDFMGR